ncbi:MAG: histidine kinase [Thermincola sp.]|jgi:signal transduction histidine kinase|nr:histidine kinase [Thermincola sp.]MDT3703840.1 histidine kinase [Thermincola sp.]
MIDVLQLNLLAMYFLYGLSYYTMGVAIAFQYRNYSSFRMAYSLSMLAAFALLHGISEWGMVFIPVGVPNFGDFPLWKLIAVQRLLQAVSYFFLFCFGIKLVSDSYNKKFFWWVILPTVLFLGWFAEFARFITLVGKDGLLEWLLVSESWSRYLLALPAGMFTAYGLALQVPEFKDFNNKTVTQNLFVASIAFGLLGLFSGLVVPQNIGGLSRYINIESFRSLAGFPIEVFRTATALLATWSITSLLAIFDLEKQRQVMESRRSEAIYRERERIARDLHDDVTQSIFAVGLDLQVTSNIVDKDSKTAADRIKTSVEELNKVIHALRTYIKGLEAKGNDEDLKTVVVTTVKELQKKSEVPIILNINLNQSLEIQPITDAEDWLQQLRQMVREALNNAIRHSKAEKIFVDVWTEEKRLIVCVKDNGMGMPAPDLFIKDNRQHLGLKNMKRRAQLILGDMLISSKMGEGTCITFSVPIF